MNAGAARTSSSTRRSRSAPTTTSPLPIGHGQTISQPWIVARMTELARNGRDARSVLEIGTGCGYQTAVLGARREARLQRRAHRRARRRRRGAICRSLKLNNVALEARRRQRTTWVRRCDVDAIVVTAGATHVPTALLPYLEARRTDGSAAVAIRRRARRPAPHRDRSDARGAEGTDARCGKICASAPRCRLTCDRAPTRSCRCATPPTSSPDLSHCCALAARRDAGHACSSHARRARGHRSRTVRRCPRARAPARARALAPVPPPAIEYADADLHRQARRYALPDRARPWPRLHGAGGVERPRQSEPDPRRPDPARRSARRDRPTAAAPGVTTAPLKMQPPLPPLHAGAAVAPAGSLAPSGRIGHRIFRYCAQQRQLQVVAEGIEGALFGTGAARRCRAHRRPGGSRRVARTAGSCREARSAARAAASRRAGSGRR